MVTKTQSTEIEILVDGHVFFECGKAGAFKDWSDLSPNARDRLEQIQGQIQALIAEAGTVMNE